MSGAELIDKLQTWMLTDDVFAAAQNWAIEHAGAIDTTSEENRLAYTTLHTEFEAWIDAKLEKWLIDVDATAEDLYGALREAIAAEPEGDAAQILSVVLAAADFDVFMQLMRDAASQAQATSA